MVKRKRDAPEIYEDRTAGSEVLAGTLGGLVALHHIAGMPFREIQEKTGVKHNTAAKKVAKAMKVGKQRHPNSKNLTAAVLVDPECLVAAPRSGAPKALTERDIRNLIWNATKIKAARYRP